MKHMYCPGGEKLEPNRALRGLCQLWKWSRLLMPSLSLLGIQCGTHPSPPTSPCPRLPHPLCSPLCLCLCCSCCLEYLPPSPTHPAGPLSETISVSELPSGCSWHQVYLTYSQGNGPTAPPAVGPGPERLSPSGPAVGSRFSCSFLTSLKK